MTTNILKQSSHQRRSSRFTQIRVRWVMIGLLLVPLVYAGFFFNYHLVYAGIAENVTFQSDDIKLSGVVVKPATPGPHPGIVLLHGAGRQTHDKWFYRIHTNEFLRQGFSVLSFDKRGSGDSEGDLQTATFQDLINDGVAAVSFLRAQQDIIADQIGLFGVSESGWFTPEIATTDGDIAFIVNRVSPPLSWTETVLFEVRNDMIAEGVSEADVADGLLLQSRIWQFYIDSTGNESYANGPEREMINALVADMQARPGLEDYFRILPDYDATEYTVRASKYIYDPLPFLTEIDIPILYIMAGQDINIPFEPSVSLVEQLKLELNKDITIQAYPEAGHYLYRWNMFPLEGFYVSGYLELIGNWAAAQIARK